MRWSESWEAHGKARGRRGSRTARAGSRAVLAQDGKLLTERMRRPVCRLLILDLEKLILICCESSGK